MLKERLYEIQKEISNIKLVILPSVSKVHEDIEYIPSFIELYCYNKNIINVEIDNPNSLYDFEQLVIFATINFYLDYYAKSLSNKINVDNLSDSYLSLFGFDVRNNISPVKSFICNEFDNAIYKRFSNNLKKDIDEYCLYNLIKYYYIYNKLIVMYRRSTHKEFRLKQMSNHKLFKFIHDVLNLNKLFKNNFIERYFIKKEIEKLKTEIKLIHLEYLNEI